MATRKTPVKRRASKTVEDVVDSVKNEVPEDATVKKVKSARKAKAVDLSAEVTIEKVTQSLTKAGLDINKTLNGVRELFESEISALETIKEAIEAKQDELEELFDKEVVLTSLRDLVLQYETKKEEWEKNLAETRDSWVKEMAEHKEKIQERDVQVAKTRQQEKEDYDYNLKIARRDAEEEWSHMVSVRQREQHETAAALEKTWREREDNLAKAESAVKELQEKLDNFDATVKAEVDKQVAIKTNAIKSQYDHSAQVKSLEFEKEKSLLAHDNTVMKSLVQAKDAEIIQLRDALSKKDSEVKEVAVAAMSAQSKAEALDAVQQHAQSTSHGKK